MTAYLRDNPPARSQFRSPRRERPTGVIVVHTAESIMDTVGEDTGAEAVARFIASRTTAGSYHDLVDSDSRIHLVEYGDEAYHVATHGWNRRSTGVSMACRTTDFQTMSDEKRLAFLTQAAMAAADQAAWVKEQTGITIPARRVAHDEALAGEPGFISHAECDPARRTDPGKWFPWTEFLELFAQFSGQRQSPAPVTTSERVTVDVNLPVLKRGAKGFAVKVMQSVLNAHGELLDEDGSFGPATGAAVRRKQSQWGLDDDESFGPKTWAAALNLPTP